MKMKVVRCGWGTIKELILNYHYLHSMPAGILACFALYEDGNEWSPIGAAVFSNGRIQYEGRYLDFSRLWLYNEIPKNSETFFIGQCLKMLVKEFPQFEGVVSWADTNRGHKGTIYRASNFVFDGMSRKTRKYKNSKGKVVYQRTVISKDNFIEQEQDKEKYRYIYYFNQKKRESLRNSPPTRRVK